MFCGANILKEMEISMDYYELWPSGPLYKGDSVQTDTLCLASFFRAPKGALCADLGTGCGILPLLLLTEREDLRFDAAEIRAEAAETARENIRKNGFDSRCRVFCGDMRSAPLEKGRYDTVICNPPYFPPSGSGKGERKTMRHESMSLPELCGFASSLLKNGGRFTLCYRPERLPELILALESSGLVPKRLRFVQHSAKHAPSLILCESLRNAGPGLTVEAPLLLRDENGAESREYLKLCHWEQSGKQEKTT